MRKDKTPYVPPVKHIELDEKKIKPRLILTIVFFIIAIIAITTSNSINVKFLISVPFFVFTG